MSLDTKEQILKLGKSDVRRKYKELKKNHKEEVENNECNYCNDCHNCYACVGLAGDHYHILNIEVTKEEYEAFIKRIKDEN